MPPQRTQAAPSCQTCQTPCAWWPSPAGRTQMRPLFFVASSSSVGMSRVRGSGASASMGETLRVTATDARDVLTVPAPADLTTMVVGILAVSTSGPLMAATVAPALAIAFWRNGRATAVLVPWTLARHRAELQGMRGRERRLAVVAGGFLALHFATWVPSLTFTTVASATALVSTQPVWAALLARRAGARIAPLAWLGIAIAVLGAAVLTGADVHTSTRAFVGDLLALVGGMAAAAYMVAGSQVRQHVSTATYTTVCYATAALLLLLTCIAGGKALAGYPASTWWRLPAVTVGAQLLGHSLFNRVLRRVSPTTVSLTLLFEVPGAALVTGVVLNPQPKAEDLPA